MSFTGLQWEPIEIPLAAGLDTKTDQRAMQPPGLLVCKDVVFDEHGGIQSRKPLVSIGNSIYPSGTLSNVRRAYRYGDELVVFTKDAIYTWNANLSKWVLRGTHLAVKTTEKPVFILPTDQVDTDRAELSGTVMYCWTDSNGLNVAALDSATGSVIYGPSAISGSSRGRLLPMSGAGRIALFFKNTLGGISVAFYDPDNMSIGGNNETEILAAANFNDYYDAVVDSAGLFLYMACRRDTTTSYSVFVIEEDGAITLSANPARTCDGPIAIALAANGTHVHVVRDDGTNIEGDYLLISDLSDVTVNQAIGTSTGNTTQIAACYRTTAISGSTYRMHVFWNSATESAANTSWSLKSNTVDTDGTIGTQGSMVDGQGLASRAFDHDGRVYVHSVFAGSTLSGVAGLRSQVQSSYFLYRDDGHLVAKQAMNVADTYRSGAAGFGSIGRLPGVHSTASGVYAWCGAERRIITTGGIGQGYSDRGPRDITITFDSNEARRVAQFGQTLYITGGQIRQFDGVEANELGFHWFPWTFAPVAAGSGGNIEAGTYTYKATYRWDNAKGERDRSSTATTQQVTCVASDEVAINSLCSLTATSKDNVAIEIWRTEKNPDLEADFYLVTGQDPAVTTGDNPYVPMPAVNSGTAVVTGIPEVLSDANLRIREANNENAGVLESLVPPAATIVAATEDRLFITGVAGEPDNIWYSKLRVDGFVASFHDGNKVSVPKAGGDITALAFLNDTLVCFRESAVYLVPGEGYDNTGGGSNYGPARPLSFDVGCVSAEAVCLTPGGLIFKSSKGWYLLNRGFALEYIGAKVADFDSDTVHAVHVVENNHHIRVVTSARVLMFDYSVGEWSEWTISDAVHAVVWNGTWHDVSATAVRAEQASHGTSSTDAIDVTTAWFKPAGMMGGVAVRRLSILGEFRTAHRLQVSVYYDYSETVAETKTWTVSPTTAGGPEQVLLGLGRIKFQAIKLRITAIQTGSSDPPTGEALKLTGIGMEVGHRGRLNRRLPVAQKV